VIALADPWHQQSPQHRLRLLGCLGLQIGNGARVALQRTSVQVLQTCTAAEAAAQGDAADALPTAEARPRGRLAAADADAVLARRKGRAPITRLIGNEPGR
jgi:hypothetical protein